MKSLRPDLGIAATALAEEISQLNESGETIVYLTSDKKRGAIYIVTWEKPEPAVKIFGFTDR